MTYDHKASDPVEQKRVKEGGGVIFQNRVSGNLAVTRALGDLSLKNEGVIVTPYVSKYVK